MHWWKELLKLMGKSIQPIRILIANAIQKNIDKSRNYILFGAFF